ncbi:MAG: rhomboid family intramembrane serine protease [Spirosomataceae bacterium]
MSGILEDFKDAFAKRNNGLVQLIWLNIAVYVLMLMCLIIFRMSDQELLFDKALRYVSLTPELPIFIYRPWTILTYSFVHAVNPIAHLLPNMLMLYWFGTIIQEFIGSRRLINLYLLGAFSGGLLAILIYNFVPYFSTNVQNVTIIGASGSVMAIVFAAATLVPDYTFFLFLLGPVRIKYIAFFFFLISLAGVTGLNAGGGIVHLGGALLGFLYIKQLQAGRDLGTPIDQTIDFINGLFRKKEKPQIKVVYRQKESSYSGNSSTNSYPDEDEVDEILDKISKSGYESLTKEEKQKLFKASQKQ